LPDNEFNINSSLKSKDGTLYFGGVTGLIHFKSADVLKERERPIIRLIENGEYLAEEDSIISRKFDLNAFSKLKLPYDHANIRLRFATNSGLFSSNKIQYQYRISNSSERWIYFDNNGLLELQSLRPGKRTLEVKAAFENIESNVLQYEIYVSNIFYKRWWFGLLMGLLVCSIAYFLHYSTNKSRKENIINQIKNKELELQALKVQMNPHFLFNTINNLQNVLINKNTETINHYFQEFTKLVNHTLTMSRVNRIKLQEEIAYLNSYLILNNMRLNDELVFSIDVDPTIDTNSIYIPPLLIQPIVENSVIHGLKPKSGQKTIKISIVMEKQVLLVKIIDNGIGRKASAELKQNSVIKMTSLSSNIFKKRMSLSNSLRKDSIHVHFIDYIDKTHDTTGTEVLLKIKL
jgi:hypothetical protein